MARSVSHPSVQRVIEQLGRTYCEQAGFTLRDTPAALYQLLLLSTLLAKPLSADLGVAAAAELRRSGYRTPRRITQTTWQQRVDALGRAHYRRYDESTATILAEQAHHLLDEYGGDLRRVARHADGDSGQAAVLLTGFPGIGPAGAQIFLREAQRVWPWLQPYVDERTIDGAGRLGFAGNRSAVERLLTRSGDPAALAAAFVRATMDDDAADDLRRGVG